MLPFSRWIDYCSLGYFISASTAARQMSQVLPRLRALGSRQFTRKRAAASRVRTAFFYKGARLRHGHARSARRGPSGLLGEPGAEDFVLGEICHRAAQHNAFVKANNGSASLAAEGNPTGAADVVAVATRLEQCLLMAPPPTSTGRTWVQRTQP